MAKSSLFLSKNQPPPIDFKRLELVANTDREKREFMILFFRMANECVTKMEQALKNNDYPSWKGATHNLKGAAGNLGMPVLEECCLAAHQVSALPCNECDDLLFSLKYEVEHIAAYINENAPALLSAAP